MNFFLNLLNLIVIMSVLNINKVLSFVNSEKFNQFVKEKNKENLDSLNFEKISNPENVSDENNEIESNVKIETQVEFQNEQYNLQYKANNDLFLLACDVPNNENVFTEFEMQCNGLIFEKNTNKIICANNNTMFTLKSNTEVEFLLNKCTMENKKTRLEYCEDGTIIRLYNYNDEWFTATNKCIDAKDSFWCSNKSFDNLFWEVFDSNLLNELDKNYTYIFILLHKENRIVVRHTQNKLVYLNRIDNETLTEDYTNIFYDIKDIKRSQIIKNLDQLLMHHPFKRGFIVKVYDDQNNNWYAYRYDFPEYTYIKSIRGNVPQIRYRYLELLKHPEMLLNFEKLYNENMFMFQMIKNSLGKLCKNIHKLYIESHVKHVTKVDESHLYYQTLRQLHAYYKTQNKMITFDVVKEKINSMEKHILRKLLGWI